MAKSSKGSAFERDMSKFLSKWINGSSDPLLFWRQIASGGLLTQMVWKDGKNLSGDIHAIHEDGQFLTDRFSIELKNGYPKASFEKHLKENKNDEIKDFWEQCIRDAEKVNKEPLLIFKKMRSGVWVGVKPSTFKAIDGDDHILNNMRMLRMDWRTEDELPPLLFVDFEQFFERVTPEHIKERIDVVK